MKYQSRPVALDRRRLDQDGHLFVDRSNISVAAVHEYLGREIFESSRNLLPNKRYRLYRSPDALRHGAESFEGKPLVFTHSGSLMTAIEPSQDLIVGSVSDVKYEHPYLVARLSLWRQDAIDAVRSGSHRELSCGYRHDIDWTAGKTPAGESYDGVMTAITGNHVALVTAGRAGKVCAVSDALPRAFELDITKLFPGALMIRNGGKV